MRKIFIMTAIFFGFSAFNIKNADFSIDAESGPQHGESLEFKLYYGIFPVGKALMKTYDDIYSVNGRSCYKVDVVGKTIGAVDLVADVDDKWGAYVDTESKVTHISYRDIKEGNYRLKELVKYDQNSNVIEVKVINNKTGKFKDPVYHSASDNMRDMIGGMYYIRSIDFSTVEKGDVIVVKAFHEDTIYENFKIMYAGKEIVETKAGTFKALKLVPLMPKNEIFVGENAITFWISDDTNKIPLKAEAEMLVGKASFELTNYKNLRSKINKL